ncbi:MAG: GNAT family N-acetyltransferase, partial [Oscillospiraceae bacterium]|nr:GNAT family N-acetyltransferase [Oscillospiraceae bacterium]
TVEGCYVPFDWRNDFDKEYLENIKAYCLVMTENYIRNNFDDIINHADTIEKRLDASVDAEEFIAENRRNLSLCEENGENEIYCQTWSGNLRMIKCAEKLGFEICKRKIDYREVNGKKYDGFTFRLNKEMFYNYLNG